MNFMEAVKAMREGKRVTVNAPNDTFWTLDILNNIIDNHGRQDISTTMVEGNWEVVDEDKDWNLAEETITWIRDETTQETKQGRFYSQANVNKCRELIIEDLNKYFGYEAAILSFKGCQDKINKRFGNLKWMNNIYELNKR